MLQSFVIKVCFMQGRRKIVNLGGLSSQQDKFSMIKNLFLWRSIRMTGALAPQPPFCCLWFYVQFYLILYHYTANNDYTWYYICRAWFLDVGLSTYCIIVLVVLPLTGYSLGVSFCKFLEWAHNLRKFIMGCCIKFDCGSLL